MGKHFKTNVKHKPKTKNKKIFKKIALNIFQLIFIALFIISSIEIVKWFKNNKSNEQIKEELSSLIEVTNDGYNVDFSALKASNSDTIAFLKVNGTDVEHVVVKTTNNDYYLSHNFKKEYNKAGWIFADYTNNFDGTDKNIVIYGHNMRDNSMFGSLTTILTEEWYDKENNKYVTLVTESETLKYEVFSIYQIEEEDYYIQTNFTDNTAFKEFLDTIKNRSIKDFNVSLSEEDSILTLSTCANSNKYRIVLHAKKVD